MMLPAKDPAEIVTVTFDYTNEIGAAVLQPSPVIGISVANGTDPAVGAMVDGVAVVSGATVLQRFKAGVDGVDYKINCLATLNDGRKLLRAATLMVRTAG